VIELDPTRLARAAQRGDQDSRDRLVDLHLPLVRALARRFSNRGEQYEDLVQVGTLALLASIDRFDGRGRGDFRTFAVPTIAGALRNHLRDRSSTIRIPRRVHELAPAVRRRQSELAVLLQRPPTPAEVAAEMHLPERDVRDVLAAPAATAPLSTTDPAIRDSTPLAAAGDLSADVADRLALADGMRALTPRERSILRLRYVDELTQAEIAQRLAISQVHVSRILRGAVQKLRRELRQADAEPIRGAA
jgi:RNA polymerase sigma-B factor